MRAVMELRGPRTRGARPAPGPVGGAAPPPGRRLTWPRPGARAGRAHTASGRPRSWSSAGASPPGRRLQTTGPLKSRHTDVRLSFQRRARPHTGCPRAAFEDCGCPQLHLPHGRSRLLGQRAEATCAAGPTAHLEPQGPAGTDGTTSWGRRGWKPQQLPRVHSQGLNDFTAENLL